MYEYKPGLVYASWLISPRCFEMSCIHAGGTLNVQRVEYFAKLAVANGATHFRLLPGLLWDPVNYPEYDFKFSDYNYLPWVITIVYGNNRFDLSHLNPVYFFNLKWIAEIMNRYGLILIFPMYDNCHWNSKKRIPHSPWFMNQNNIDWMFDDTSYTGYHELYENAVLEALKGKKFMIEFGNEIGGDINEQDKLTGTPLTILIPFCKRLYKKLKDNGIQENRMITGVRYSTNGKVSKYYESWRHGVGIPDSLEAETKLAAYRSIHQFRKLSRHEDIYAMQWHSGLGFFSFDGDVPQVTEKEAKAICDGFFSRKDPKKNRFKKQNMIEWLYQGKSEKNGLRGVARSFYQWFGFYPGPDPLEVINLVDPGNPELPPETKPPVQPPIIPPEKPPIEPEPEQKEKSTFIKRLAIGGIVKIVGVAFAMRHKPFKLPWIITAILACFLQDVPWILRIFKQK